MILENTNSYQHTVNSDALPVDIVVGRTFEDADVRVFDYESSTHDPVELVLGTDFTLSGVGGETTVHLTAKAHAGTSLIIAIVAPRAYQPNEYNPNDDFPAESHEAALDRLTRLVQSLQSLYAKVLRYPDADPRPSPVFGIDQRSNKVLAFDQNGDPVFTVNLDDVVSMLNRDPATYDQLFLDLGGLDDPEAIQQKLRRGTTAEHADFDDGGQGELTIDIQLLSPVLHDGLEGQRYTSLQVPDLTALSLFNNAKLVDGQLAFVASVGRFYQLDLSDPGPTPDGTDIIVANAGGAWVVSEYRPYTTFRNTRVHVSASDNPTATSDATAGFSIGSFWANVSSGQLFMCVSAAIGAADWFETARKVVAKTTFPGPSDNASDGFSVGSIWTHTPSRQSYVLKEFSGTDAVWIRTGVRAEVSASTAPSVNNDASEGFIKGDFWITETPFAAYQLVDETTGAAVWQRTTDRPVDLTLTAPAVLDPVSARVLVDFDTADIITLPLASAATGSVITVKRLDEEVTVQRQGTDLIDGETTYTLEYEGDFVTLFSNGTDWNIIGIRSRDANPGLIQFVYKKFTDVVSTTATWPQSPTITDGVELFAQSFTPKSATSKLHITAMINLCPQWNATSETGRGCSGLFMGTTLLAGSAVFGARSRSKGYGNPMHIVVDSPGVGEVDFSVRIGAPNYAGWGPFSVHVNSATNSTGPEFGIQPDQKVFSWLKIEEIEINE